MPTKYTVTVSYMGTSSVIAIPKPVCDGFGLQKGQKLDLIVRDDGIYIPMQEPADLVEQVKNSNAATTPPRNSELAQVVSKYTKDR